MLILSRVCVEFRTRKGAPLFEVTPSMINTFQEAPEAIQEDPIFALLTADGSLEAVVPKARRKELENDPLQDTDPDGKRRKPAEKEVQDPVPEVPAPAGEPEARSPKPGEAPETKAEKKAPRK